MSEILELKKAWEDTKTTWENDFKKTVFKGEEERKQFGDQLGQTKETIAKMNAAIDKNEKIVEELNAKAKASELHTKALEQTVLEMKRLPANQGNGKLRVRDELKKFFSEEKAYDAYLRRGERSMAEAEHKALATDADTAGGFLLSDNRMQEVIELNVLYSPIRQVCDVQTISLGDTLEIPREGATSFQVLKVGERATRPETTAGTFEMARIPTHEFYANPWATRKMIDDPAINVEQYIAKKVGQQKGKDEGARLLTGSGVGEPQGIDLGGSSLINVTTSDVFTAAKLIAFQYSLEEPYASQATWLSKRANFGKIRQLTATTGDFLWQPGLQAGEPSLLLNRPVLACNDITLLDGTATATTKIIYFGDFKSGYKIVDRIGIRMIRDEFTNKPHVEFYHYWRMGGQVVLPEAIKIGVSD